MFSHEYDNLSGKGFVSQMLYFGEVISIDDPFESRTIKVKIPEIDKKVDESELPPCYPLFPPFFHFLPKVGERVVIIMDRIYNAEKTINQEKRYYLGVTISQPQNINKDPYYYSASSNETDGWTQRGTPISEIPEAKGTYLEKDQIGIAGRNNTQLTFKDGEVSIMSGKHVKENVTKFNDKNPAYIQVRYATENASTANNTRTVTKIENIPPSHSINVVSDANNRLQIKVIRLLDNRVDENFSGSYDGNERLIQASKEKIKEFQLKYPKWQLRTTINELNELPQMFKNNQRVVKVQEQVRSEREIDAFQGSVLNMVADKINLLSHLSEGNFDLTTPQELIDSDAQVDINTNAHPLAYGDRLVEYFKLVNEWIKNHVHPYHGLSCDKDEITKKLLNFNLDSLLNKNIRIG